MKNASLFLLAAFASAMIFTGCKTTAPYGQPAKTIENPLRPEEYDSMSAKYRVNGELWRGDPMAVCQIEIYKLEGKAAVLLDQRLIAQEDDGIKQIIEVTTRKNIYWFHLEKPNYAAPVWWINRVEVYSLPSDDPAKNPALRSSPEPVFRQPTGLSPEERPSEKTDPAAP
jgi:hypothetical protein